VRAEQLAPYVVVTGIRMPGMDGIEATRRITAGSATPPKVLILTTCDDDYLYDALRAGASGLLVKDRGPRRHACLRDLTEIHDAHVSRHRGQPEPFRGRAQQCAPQFVGGLRQRPHEGCGEGGLDGERARR
jgi:DNA-binding NarL/FixJ family response regulator